MPQSNEEFAAEIETVFHEVGIKIQECRSANLYFQDAETDFLFASDGFYSLKKANAESPEIVDRYAKITVKICRRISRRLDNRLWHHQNESNQQ